MLRINHRSSVRNAKAYFEHVLNANYYGQESPGLLLGKGAEMLGFEEGQEVSREAFHALCDNKHPETGQKLTVRERKRVYYDMTFSAPKSVSVMHAIMGDEGILEAFQEAVREALREMEATDMRTRVRSHGQDHDRRTRNFVAALFDEFTTRPVDGLPDPHMHCHSIIWNNTFDFEENRWKAGQFGEIKRNASYYQATFEARLARGLTEIGYAIERTAKGWEIAGVPDTVNRKFSNRTAQIERVAQELHITDPEIKAQLGATTREHKMLVPMEELKQTWEARLTPEEWVALNAAQEGDEPPHDGNAQAIDFALAHCLERQSAVPERRLLAEALIFGVGYVTPEEIRAELLQRDILTGERDGQIYYTTPEVLAEERDMIALAMQGRGTKAALKLEPHAFRPIMTEDGRSFSLNAEQQAAVRHVLQSNDFVTLIRGAAGVGKTTLMREAVQGIEDGGRKVFVFAPSADASRGVLRNEGFSDADTLHQLLTKNALQEQVRGNVIWVDEAGLMGSRQMSRLLKLAKEMDSRVVLSGDAKQHRAVERGDALRILETVAGLEAAEVTEITRQKGLYKRAVKDLSEGKADKGFRTLERMGAIVELDGPERHEQLTQDYLDATHKRTLFGKNRTALVVSPTHHEGEEVTKLIREKLHALPETDPRRLGRDEHTVLRQRNLNWTEAQRKDARQYQAGHIVQFVQHAKGIRAGARLTVNGVDPEGNVVVSGAAGDRVTLELNTADRFQVYEADTLVLATGDRIRITQNGWTHEGQRIDNGALYNVQGFTRDGDIIINANRGKAVIDREYGNLAHGYVTTSHAAQGKTVDSVFIAQGTESLRASGMEQFYVSVSRGRRDVKVYTNDREALREAVQASGDRLAATELIPDRAQQPNGERERRKTWERLAAWARGYGDALREGLEGTTTAFTLAAERMNQNREPERDR